MLTALTRPFNQNQLRNHARATKSAVIPIEQSSMLRDVEPDVKGCVQGEWGLSGVWLL